MKEKLTASAWQLFGIALFAGGLIAARRYWEPSFFLGDIRPFLPREKTTLTLALILAAFVVAYHHWYAQFERMKSALTIFLVGFLLGFGAYVIVVCLFRYPDFKSFEAFFRIVFDPQKKDISSAHTLGKVLMAFIQVGGLWAAIPALFGKGPMYPTSSKEFHQRGRMLLDFSFASKTAEKVREEHDPGLVFGGLLLPSSAATSHFGVIGSTGSGKTITLRLLMQSALQQIRKGGDCRALVYDAKGDSLSILSGMKLGCEILILNPFDARCVAWDMAKDITAPATAQQIAAILIPENKNSSQPFFGDAARHLLSGVLISFIKRLGERWTFRDVLLALKSRERLISVLGATQETKELCEAYFTDDLTARNVMSTVATKMARYEFIAAAWERAERSLSLREWVRSDSILVLGNDEASRTALDAINQVLFKRLSELILAQSESATRRTWIFLDELRQAGRLEGLSSLLTKGRSKGASIALGYQDIEGLREVYGYQLANEIAGQCANKAILRCDSADTARWASALFGEKEVLERRESTGSSRSSSISLFSYGGSQSGRSTHVSESVVKREAILPSEIMSLPQTTLASGLPGFYISPVIGAWGVTLLGASIRDSLMPRDGETPDLISRDEGDQYLRAWDEDDLARLSLPKKSAVEKEVTPEANGEALETPLSFVKRREVQRVDVAGE